MYYQKISFFVCTPKDQSLKKLADFFPWDIDEDMIIHLWTCRNGTMLNFQAY